MTNVQSKLRQFFTDSDFQMPEISLLQPADPFLDTAGEDIRRRIFMTRGSRGEHLCLRPEFTIPVCLAHLNGDQDEGTYAYLGNVFRQRRSGPAEFYQAGTEIIGGAAGASQQALIDQDVDCIITARDALEACGLDQSRIILGDHAIFEAVLKALQLPEPWRARLARSFGDGQKIEHDLLLITGGGHGINNGEDELQTALEQMDRKKVIRSIENRMRAANMPMSGGRTAEDIAERMITKAELAASSLSSEQLGALADFFRIEVPLHEAEAALVVFAERHNVALKDAIDLFALRTGKLCDQFNGRHELIWRANFGRPLDYYTGIVFEVFAPGADIPVCGGGRYDHLMEMLGAEQQVPAIGFSIWIDRLEGVTA